MLIDPKMLGAEELELFPEPPNGLLFQTGPGAAPLQLVLEAQKPRYSATVEVEATVAETSLTQSYLVRFSPESSRLDRLLVQFSPPLAGPLHWTFASEEAEPPLVRAYRSTGRPKKAAGQTWEILLRRPRSESFGVRASHTQPLTGSQAISLASLPGATLQQGTLVIRGASPAAIRVENHRLAPIPAEAVLSDREAVGVRASAGDGTRSEREKPSEGGTPTGQEMSPSPAAAYRYDPAGEQVVSAEAAIYVGCARALRRPPWPGYGTAGSNRGTKRRELPGIWRFSMRRTSG